MAGVGDAENNAEALKQLLSSSACNYKTTLKVGPMSIHDRPRWPVVIRQIPNTSGINSTK